jgi:hypothetical protein
VIPVACWIIVLSSLNFERPRTGGRFARNWQMTLMELLGMERLQLQTRSELETLRKEARAGQVLANTGRRITPHARLCKSFLLRL